MFGKDHTYFIENYFKKEDGDYVDINTLSPSERTQFSGNGLSDLSTKLDSADRYQCMKWTNDNVVEVYNRQFLLRNVAVELFLSDGRSFFLTVSTITLRDLIYSKMIYRFTKQSAGVTDALLQNSIKSQFFGISGLKLLTDKWVQREMSNFDYIMLLNTIAGRTFNDLTQYPVFPWVLKNYTSENIDINDPTNYRDLSKPMGAQGPKRAAKFLERIECFEDTGPPPSHYATHYSSAMIVCSYLIRLEPYTRHYLQLQGGNFDLPVINRSAYLFSG